MATIINLLFLQMDYTTLDGGSFPGALFYAQSINFDNNLLGGGAGAGWYGYKDIAHLLAGESFVQIHDYTPSAEYFAAISAPVTAGASQAADVGQTLAMLALSHKTTPGKNADGTAQVDANGQPVMVSPFAGAQVVVLPVPLP